MKERIIKNELMPTEQEIKDFAYFNKYGKKTQSNKGKLWYDGFVQAQGNFALLQYKKKELISRGFIPSKFRITY